MHNFWIVIFGLVASLWVVQGVRASIGMARLPWLSDVSPVASGNGPMISVIFAARDEKKLDSEFGAGNEKAQ